MATKQTKFERVATTENGRIFKNADLVRHLLGFESVEEAMLAIEPSFPDEGDRTAFITIANLIYLDIKKQEYTSDYAYHTDELPHMVWDTFQEYQGLKGTDDDFDGTIPFEAWLAVKVLQIGKDAYRSGPTDYDHFLYSNETKSGKHIFLNNGKGSYLAKNESLDVMMNPDTYSITQEKLLPHLDGGIDEVIQRIDGLDKQIIEKLNKINIYQLGIIYFMYLDIKSTNKERTEKRGQKIYTYKSKSIKQGTSISKYLSHPAIIELAKSSPKIAKLIKTTTQGVEYIDQRTVAVHFGKIKDLFTVEDIVELKANIEAYMQIIEEKLKEYKFQPLCA